MASNGDEDVVSEQTARVVDSHGVAPEMDAVGTEVRREIKAVVDDKSRTHVACGGTKASAERSQSKRGQSGIPELHGKPSPLGRSEPRNRSETTLDREFGNNVYRRDEDDPRNLHPTDATSLWRPIRGRAARLQRSGSMDTG